MILALTESAVPLTIPALRAVLAAKLKQERIQMYIGDLVYLNVKAAYKGHFDADMPSKYADRLYSMKKPDKRTGKQIIEDLRKRLMQE